MSRLIAPRQGHVLLDGKSVHRTPTRELARTLGLLPQSPIAPEGITVADLVSRGRHPHQGIDRKSVVQGQRVSVRVDLGGRRLIKKNNNNTIEFTPADSQYTHSNTPI